MNSINKPLNELTQKQIGKLNESVRDTLFIKEQAKTKKQTLTHGV